MFKPLVTHIIQHLLAQNDWAKPRLEAFSGKSIAFDFSIVRVPMVILEDGQMAIAGETATMDATVHLPPSLALRLLSGEAAAKSFIKIDGDIHLASALGQLLQDIRWDVEEDLSKVVGDIAAFQLLSFSQKAFTELKGQTINLAEMLKEYWQEEQPMLAKKRHIERFDAEVNQLRDDTARLEKRVQKYLKATQRNQPLEDKK